MDKNFLKQNLYGFTIKETFTKEIYLNESTYDDVLNKLKSKGDILHLRYENVRKDGITKARLHIHGIIEFKIIPKLNSICGPGYSTKFEKIYDLRGWTKYCNKNEENSDEKIDNKIYMFDD